MDGVGVEKGLEVGLKGTAPTATLVSLGSKFLLIPMDGSAQEELTLAEADERLGSFCEQGAFERNEWRRQRHVQSFCGGRLGR